MWQRPVLWGLVLPGCLLIAQAIYVWGITIDDAAISYRYAAHLAAGKGLIWNPGGSPVEGYSNFLWVLILAAAKWVGLEIETVAQALGLGLGLISLTLLYVLCRSFWAPRPLWWLPVILVASTPEWVMWIISGLEIALFCALLVLSLVGLLAKSRVRLWLLVIALPGLVLTRPEGSLMAGIMIACGVLAESGSAWERLRSYAAPIGVVFGVVMGLLVFRLVYFGSPLPNTVYAKFSWELPSLRLVGRWLAFGIPFWLAWGIILAKIRNQRHRWVLTAAVMAVLCEVIVVLPVVPVMYFMHRYQIALLPFLVLAIPGLSELPRRPRLWMGVLATLLLLGWTVKEWPEAREWQENETNWIQRRREVAEALSLLPPDASLALIDAGFIPYWTDLPTLDIWGLCDRRIAREGFSAEKTMAEKPDAIVMAIHVGGDGRMEALQGRDELIAQTSAFRARFNLWKGCGRPRRAGEGNYDGYAIFLDSAWARAHGITKLPDL